MRKAKVLVINPTHYAVALDYEKNRTPLPVILAKGEGFLAQRMIPGGAGRRHPDHA